MPNRLPRTPKGQIIASAMKRSIPFPVRAKRVRDAMLAHLKKTGKPIPEAQLYSLLQTQHHRGVDKRTIKAVYGTRGRTMGLLRMLGKTNPNELEQTYQGILAAARGVSEASKLKSGAGGAVESEEFKLLERRPELLTFWEQQALRMAKHFGGPDWGKVSTNCAKLGIKEQEFNERHASGMRKLQEALELEKLERGEESQ